ncbi:MAG TPA: isochorismatase family protein [Actinobacteria bacterium]|nr:isochorismatase family protein [Actinomycetota bacterium]
MSTYDPATALVVVDVQNDFADPKGALSVPGGDEIIDVVDAEIAAAADAGATIVYTQDWHPPSTPHFEKDGGIWPVHCVADTWGAEFHPRLDVRDDGVFVKKGTGGEDGYSAFTVRDPVTGETTPTGLTEVLEGRGVRRVVVVGLATDYCVKETALDAVREGFDTVVLADGIRAVNLRPGDGARAVYELCRAGVVIE